MALFEQGLAALGMQLQGLADRLQQEPFFAIEGWLAAADQQSLTMVKGLPVGLQLEVFQFQLLGLVDSGLEEKRRGDRRQADQNIHLVAMQEGAQIGIEIRNDAFDRPSGGFRLMHIEDGQHILDQCQTGELGSSG
ncbi:MAG: hypothetical protein WCH37_01310 [Synechococcaceae cyanobacterium ELA182]